ncbi:MAG TPA: hypothetical protein VF089_04420 [Candidatus Binatia bacterium]
MQQSSYRILRVLIVGAMVMGNLFFADESLAAQSVHQHQDGRTNRSERSAQAGKLLPAQGASVKILSPTKDQIFPKDQIPLEFRIVKGKRGHHVHAYVNGELMGMFNSQTGTLTGLKPGKHVLELRVIAEDHKSELDAIDKVSFVVQ